MVESLIMAQQFEAAQTILQQAPVLQDDMLLRHYARQASLTHSKALLYQYYCADALRVYSCNYLHWTTPAVPLRCLGPDQPLDSISGLGA